MTFHVGLIGGGNITETHARAVLSLDGVVLSAIYGTNRARVEEMTRRLGGAPFTDFELFLSHRPMDLVIIGNPSGRHAESGIAAACRGLHVLVEKPIDVVVSRAEALIDECNRAGVKLAVIYQDRVRPDVLTLKRLIHNGVLGKPLLVTASVKWYRPPEYYSESKWRGRIDLDGGGALMNQGTHTVDLLLHLAGDVTRVCGKAVTALHRIQSEDIAVATLEFANGAVGTIEATTAAYPGFDRRLELTFTKGTIVLERDRVVRAALIEPISEFQEPGGEDANPSSNSPVISDLRGHAEVIRNFLQSIERGDAPYCDGPEGLRSVRLVCAVYESSRTGQPVSLK